MARHKKIIRGNSYGIRDAKTGKHLKLNANKYLRDSEPKIGYILKLLRSGSLRNIGFNGVFRKKRHH